MNQNKFIYIYINLKYIKIYYFNHVKKLYK